jgi:hypothetical protein
MARHRLSCSSLIVLLASSAGTLGCAGSSQYMKEVPSAEAVHAPADRATVVFVRPSGIGFAINFAILDQQGHWVGDAVAETHFAVSLPPGDYMFVGWAENTAALKASLGNGRVYYVEVYPVMGAFSSQVQFEALTPRSGDWSKLAGWLKTTKRLEPIPTGVAHIDAKRDDALKRVASAKENWDGYSNPDKARKTLHLEDGTAPEGAGAVAAPQACGGGAPCPGVAAPPAAPSPPQAAPNPAPPANPPVLAASAAPVAQAPGASCTPACKSGFVCAPSGQCVSACNPSCGAHQRCTDAGTCVDDAPLSSVARAPDATHAGCFPACRKGYLCSPRGQCVSACNPPCDAGQRCSEAGLCESK